MSNYLYPGTHANTQARPVQLVDTETGSAAEAAFTKFGYVEVGKIPGFSQASPAGKKGETFFYKDLVPSS